MKLPSFRLSFFSAVPSAQRPLLLCAAVVAVALLSFYVHLLHESMALGNQMRERQRASASLGYSKPSPRLTSVRSAQASDAVDAEKLRTR